MKAIGINADVRLRLTALETADRTGQKQLSDTHRPRVAMMTLMRKQKQKQKLHQHVDMLQLCCSNIVTV